jgi:hypothetical protein
MSSGKIATGLRPPLLLLLALAAFGAAGCSTITDLSGLPNAPQTDAPTRAVHSGHLTPAQQMSHDDADAKLLALGIEYRRVPDVDDDHGCSVHDGVEIHRIGKVTLTRPALLTQDMAVRLGHWVHEVLEPEARKIYHAQLASIEVFGSYSCRNIYGKPFGGMFDGRLSEHAFANAVDIGGFEFTDGRKVKFARNWRSKGGPGSYLHDAALAACSIFNTTLTPDYDRYHSNHIHIDASPKKEVTQKFCGVRGHFNARAVPAFARYHVRSRRGRRHAHARHGHRRYRPAHSRSHSHHPPHKHHRVTKKKRRTKGT